MKRIESRNNPTIKNITSLRDKRERESQRLFFFEGVHLLEEYLRFGKTPHAIFVREDVTERYAELLSRAECEKYEVTASVYEKLSEEKAPQGILTVSGYPDNVKLISGGEYCKLPEKIKGNAIMLANLQDNGNVGTVIRTAATLDCDVILCGKCADIFSAKTARATMGALFAADIYVCPDTVEAVKALEAAGKRVIAAALDDKASLLGEFEILQTDIFVVGNEGKGLTQEVISACGKTAIIPMSGKTESLNAATAAAILLWEAKRGKIK